MSKIASTAGDEDDSGQSRVQSKFNSLLASAPAHISQQLHPKRNPHSWFVFRLALGFFGAALVLLPLALPESWIASIFGLAFFLTSILLPPVLKSHLQEESSDASFAKPQSAIVLKGADFCPDLAPPVRVQLYVSEEQILAIKLDLQPAVVVPTALLSSVFLQRAENSWFLFLLCSDKETVFSFRGFFGERNARKAEFAIRQHVRLTPPQKPKVRAASA